MRALKYKLLALIVIATSTVSIGLTSASAAAMPAPSFAVAATGNICGDRNDDKVYVKTSIDFGCQGKGNPILDMMFAIIRLLSNGVGIIIIGSIIVGGIQYTMSAGNPQAATNAIGRIRSTLIALVLYIFAYPLLNYVLPAGFFK